MCTLDDLPLTVFVAAISLAFKNDFFILKEEEEEDEDHSGLITPGDA